jgi:hypothetical protein
VAAFFQPAVGRAFLGGSRAAAVAINQAVYGGPLLLTAGLAVLLFIAAGILLGIAASRTQLIPRWAGYTFAASVTVFAIGTFVGVPLVRPVAGLGIAGAGVRFAMAVRGSTAEGTDVRSPQDVALNHDRKELKSTGRWGSSSAGSGHT